MYTNHISRPHLEGSPLVPFAGRMVEWLPAQERFCSIEVTVTLLHPALSAILHVLIETTWYTLQVVLLCSEETKDKKLS
jgi:hypothetical protein